ncbi:Na(+)-translocating NADH-quinone reductase subunit A [Parachlamydia sp. AcF125]|uniref:Na(+)-translocating NADH-quinone reductase subunit A n=1 Tax=Parachlamydia sp. AcF125 TaxID=2795736 RepID=UPI001BC9C229|nr:Na(+)-translocating NADH-quinone reductase subunit A [Parachlamydia sp. AcF125]MBS4167717.1 Na(+)-translocating NADH-quinone reductase subunit A [Parachlamydia sp. AcF125]
MTHIHITKGLDIPIKGKPSGEIKPFIAAREGAMVHAPGLISLNLKPFEETKFRLLAKVDERVKIGQPLAEDKEAPGRMFVSPAGGVVKEIRRGLKRRLLDIVIEIEKNEEFHLYPSLNVDKASREEILEHLKAGGLFACIRSRPFNILANPHKIPKAIFVKAVESAPFAPPSEMQIQGHEKDFQRGLNALTKLTEGKVHLVYRENTSSQAFLQAQHVEKHTVNGPHPVSHVSLHIQHIDPIRSPEDTVWTLTAADVAAIGYFLTYGKILTERVISIAGPGVIENQIGYYKIRAGQSIDRLIAGKIRQGSNRLISGDPLMGERVEANDFLGFYHHVLSVISENSTREFLHFFRLGSHKFSFSRAYASGHFDNSQREYEFTTNRHGEHRAFIDSSLYNKVMPLEVPCMELVKAVMAEDYDLAEALGLLEVDSEDFALPTFVCPSKMEMTEIIKNGLRQYAKELSS